MHHSTLFTFIQKMLLLFLKLEIQSKNFCSVKRKNLRREEHFFIQKIIKASNNVEFIVLFTIT